MDNDQMKQAAVDTAKIRVKDKAGEPTGDLSREVRTPVEKAGEPPYRGFSTADDPTRADRIPVDHQGGDGDA